MRTKKSIAVSPKVLVLVKSKVAAIEKAKERLAVDRDKLRELHSDLEDILDGADCAIEDIENGLNSIEAGVTTLSGHI